MKNYIINIIIDLDYILDLIIISRRMVLRKKNHK